MSSTRKNPSRKSSKAHPTPLGSLTSSQEPSLHSPSSFSANTALSTATVTASLFTSTTTSPGNLRQRRDLVANPSTPPTLSTGVTSTTLSSSPSTMASNIGGNSVTSNAPGVHQTQPMYHQVQYVTAAPGMYSPHQSALQAAQQRHIKVEDVKHEGALYVDSVSAGFRMGRNTSTDSVGAEDDEEPVPLFTQLIDPNAQSQMSRTRFPQNQYPHDPRINPAPRGGGASNPVSDPTLRANYRYPYNANPPAGYGYPTYSESAPTNSQQRPALYEVAQSVIKHEVPDDYVSPPEMRPAPVPSYAQEQLLPPSNVLNAVVSFDPNELPPHRRNPQAPNYIVQNTEQGYALMRYLEENRHVKPEPGNEDVARRMVNSDPRGPGYSGYGNENEDNWSAQPSPVRSTNPQAWTPHQTEGDPTPVSRPYFPTGQAPPQAWMQRTPHSAPSERGNPPFFQPPHPTHSAHPSRENMQWTQSEGRSPSHPPLQPHLDIDGRAENAMRWQNPPAVSHRSGSWENPGEAPTSHGNASGYPANDTHPAGVSAGPGPGPIRTLNTRVGRVSVGGGTGSSHPSPTTWSPSTTSQPHTSHPPWLSNQHLEHPHPSGIVPLDGRVQTPGGTGAAPGSNTAYGAAIQPGSNNPGIQPTPNNSAYGPSAYPAYGSQGGPPESFPRAEAMYPPQPRPPPPGMNAYPSGNVAHQQASGVMGGGGGGGPSPASGDYGTQQNPSGNPYPQIPNQPPRPGTTVQQQQQQQQHFHQQPPPNATSNMYPAIYPTAPHPNRNESIDGPYSSTNFRGQGGHPSGLPNYPLGAHPQPPNVTTQQARQIHQNPPGAAGSMQNMNTYPQMTGPGGPDMYGSAMNPYAAPPHSQ